MPVPPFSLTVYAKTGRGGGVGGIGVRFQLSQRWNRGQIPIITMQDVDWEVPLALQDSRASHQMHPEPFQFSDSEGAWSDRFTIGDGPETSLHDQ
mgnify:CR=1 FL=1